MTAPKLDIAFSIAAFTSLTVVKFTTMFVRLLMTRNLVLVSVASLLISSVKVVYLVQ